MGGLDLESRRTIFQTVSDNPGIHFRDLLERLEYAQGTLQYHLRELEKADLLEPEDDGKFTRYYAAGEFDETDRTVINALRREYARRIIAHLAAEGPQTTSGLADRLERSPSTISWHLSKLDDAGLVERDREGRSVYYELTDPDRVTYLYTIYRKSLKDRVVDRLFDLWDVY